VGTVTGVGAADLFRAELGRRGIGYSVDEGSGRYRLAVGGTALLVSLDNLARQLRGDAGDAAERVSGFVDTVTRVHQPEPARPDGLFWCLEPNGYAESGPYREPVSPRLDRVPAHESTDGEVIAWVTTEHLEALGLTVRQAGERAWANLAATAADADLHTEEIAGVNVGYLVTDLVAKASLVLAPNLHHLVSACWVGRYSPWCPTAASPSCGASSTRTWSPDLAVSWCASTATPPTP
jgi:hypothetical protein